MKVQLEKSFAIAAPAQAAWALLQNIERVAGCMPGAKITERADDQHFKGTVSVKVGPASMSFRGEVEVKLIEPSTQTLRLIGKGTDSTGSSAASMDLTARVEAVDAVSCTLIGTSEVSMSGKAAAFGGRMMNAVADQVLKQFADNFAAQLQTLTPAATAQPAGSAQPTESASPDAAVPAAPSQLDGLALAWAVFKQWLRSLFAPKKA